MNIKTKKKTINSLYVHIPFCDKICPYCDFAKVISNDKLIIKYIDSLLNDINSLRENGYKFKTIYIGGGTPSVLNVDELERLLSNLSFLLDKNDGYEFSFEANPESIDEDKLKVLKKYDVNRISLGIQSFNKDILKTLDRDYNIDYFNLINLIKKYISNINVDLIYGLPNQSKDDLLFDLDNFIKLDINHISTYSLSVNEGTMFFNKNVKEIDSDLSREYYDLILNYLRKHDFERYEVSNFSKKGFESKHNLTYWRNEYYFGIGVGASGYVPNLRYKLSNNISLYIKGERKLIENEKLSLNDDREYYLITNLRLKEGFDIQEYNDLYNKNFLIDYKDVLNKLIKEKLINIDNNRVYCTDEGLIILNQVLVDFL